MLEAVDNSEVIFSEASHKADPPGMYKVIRLVPPLSDLELDKAVINVICSVIVVICLLYIL